MLLRNYLQSDECGTGPIAGLTNQILARLRAQLPPGTLVDISAHVDEVGATTLPFVQKAGAEALIAAIVEKGERLPIVHALRVLPQQLALRHWAERDRCDITVAARPSRSNHEGANAIDVKKEHINSWKNVLNNHGWIQNVPNDRPHFEFTGDHDPDFVQKAVLAFQELWNMHNPDDQIAEDGNYGTETEKRLKASPIEGF